MFKILKLALFSFALFTFLMFLSSCSSKQDVDIANISNVKWKLYMLNEFDLVESNTKAFITFGKDNNSFTGNLACNNFFGKYTIQRDKLKLDIMGATMMLCKDMEIENLMVQVFNRTDSIKISFGYLYLLDKNNKKIATFSK